MNVSFPQAALGDEVTIQTLSGEKNITVPQGVEHDKILTLKGEGIPRIGSSQKGDHHVVVKLTPPKSMNDEEKNLYAKLFEIAHKKKFRSNIINKVKNAFNK